ncbi:hypothetical protein [Bifidobacterium sp. ESL0764]|uniref:hypothetical protein n=1 Tax=Bifidobacterium sp. ESL0764 TaxID=2983228 RepID=UPI0023F9F195|nr:hypothetical protein [Bifidobacterium sp. ESL0764]WEV65863.1 hypothetical protein OZX71_00365 [Bifidobacterium sp. ESL0764]
MAHSKLIKGGVALTATVCMLLAGASTANAADPAPAQAAPVTATQTAPATTAQTNVDKTALQNEVNSVPAGFDDWQGALADAKAKLADANATQEDVDTALQNLKDAVADAAEDATNPVPEPTDAEKLADAKAALEVIIKTAQTKKEADYTPATWATFAAALQAAEQEDANPSATADTLATKSDELVKATNGLQKKSTTPTHENPVNPFAPKPDVSMLTVLVNDFKYYTESMYTPETWAPFAEANANGKADLEEANSEGNSLDQAAIDKDVVAIETAGSKLEFTSAQWKKFLQSDVDYAYSDNFKQSDYTAETWKPFDAARAAGKAALDSVTRAEPDYKALDNALMTAEFNLKKVKPASDTEKKDGAAKKSDKKSDKKLATTGASISAAVILMFMALGAAGAFTALRKRD